MRRVLIAVEAHIRHIHTDYEALLKRHRQNPGTSLDDETYFGVRHEVSPICQTLFSQWQVRSTEGEYSVEVTSSDTS